MVSAGCVAKLLSGMQMGSCYWLKRVNPYWYEAREVPKTMLSDKCTAKRGANHPRKVVGRSYNKYMSPAARQANRI
ncbi:uncharacterized protein Dvir_GJ26390 [Drosophila virilis]|uniref:Uncharacterized protein n=1 Tax=Drosophila virilis TaxID=7244 RepID=A0A0Q9WG33_DROVI|nr:uncharacterized protein Dvir_GJ26390 [Drosophila virilis]